MSQLEQALLDPTNVFGNSGISIRFSQLANEGEVLSLREQFRREQRVDLLDALDVSLDRARKVGSWREADLLGDPERFREGDYLAG